MEPHEVLGVSPNASSAEVSEAYRTLAQIYHPDRYVGAPEDVRREAERRMKELNEAYKAARDRAPARVVSGGPNAGPAPGIWVGTMPGTWARWARRSGDQLKRDRGARRLSDRAAQEHDVQAQVARDMRMRSAREAPRGDARARRKARSARGVVGGLGQALHTNELRCGGCRSIQRLPGGWRDRLADTEYLCSLCGQVILSR